MMHTLGSLHKGEAEMCDSSVESVTRDLNKTHLVQLSEVRQAKLGSAATHYVCMI